MIPVITPGFERANGGAFIMAEHMFDATADHQLAHYINGDLRAVVPPEGWDDYLADWPAAEPIINALKG